MRLLFTFLLFVFVFQPFAVFADDAAPPLAVEDIPVLEKTVGIASMADAYNAYCKKPTELSQEFINKFVTQDMPEGRVLGLKEIKDVFFTQTMAELNERQADCEVIDFMMERYDIMKQLRALSYEVQGMEVPPEKPMFDGPLPSGLELPEAL